MYFYSLSLNWQKGWLGLASQQVTLKGLVGFFFLFYVLILIFFFKYETIVSSLFSQVFRTSSVKLFAIFIKKIVLFWRLFILQKTRHVKLKTSLLRTFVSQYSGKPVRSSTNDHIQFCNPELDKIILYFWQTAIHTKVQSCKNKKFPALVLFILVPSMSFYS